MCSQRHIFLNHWDLLTSKNLNWALARIENFSPGARFVATLLWCLSPNLFLCLCKFVVWFRSRQNAELVSDQTHLTFIFNCSSCHCNVIHLSELQKMSIKYYVCSTCIVIVSKQRINVTEMHFAIKNKIQIKGHLRIRKVNWKSKRNTKIY